MYIQFHFLHYIQKKNKELRGYIFKHIKKEGEVDRGEGEIPSVIPAPSQEENCEGRDISVSLCPNLHPSQSQIRLQQTLQIQGGN